YPRARAMKRKLILHVGPTNSGKTYNALRALASAKRGVYGGPLRLLAHEVWERLNNGSIMAPLPARGLYGRSCNLITGEERRIVDSNADLVSCTLEMMPVESSFDVAVIDEIQMIGDIDRGGAWTRAVLGVCAQEVHMCGEATVIDLIRRIAEETGDELEINHYERLTPLKVSEPLSGSYKNIEKGDCVVAFSRKDIFATKAAIEQETGLQCAVAYGKLPPEVRSRQAELFNDPASGFDVLVASDAIGMGLNLKIKRMIFSTVTKWDGREEVYLSLSQTKQLAGRAGRFGTGQGNEGGLVTTFQSADIQHLQEAMESENPPITQAIINLPYDARHDVYQSLATDSGIARASAITELLTIPSTNYFPRPSDHDLPRLAFLDKISSGAPFTDLDSVAIAPFQWSNRFDGDAQEELMRTFFRTLNVALKPLFERTGCSKSVQDARKIQETITAAAANAVNPDAEQSDSSIDATDAAVEASLIDEQIIKSTLAGLEPAHRLLVLYLWMSWRRPLAFQDQELAFEYKAEVENHISFLLNHL
ncbi:P-loop containing nucleoside triphosphate hydrolase protein, partial [Clavulina sp. PMI_390]